MLEREVSNNPDAVDATVAMWNLAVQIEQPERAAAAMLELLRRAARCDDQELVLLQWPEVIQVLPDIEMDPALAVRLAEILLRGDRRPLAEETVELAWRRLTAETSTVVVLRLARIAAGLRLPAAAELVGILDRRELDMEVETELERVRSEVVSMDLSVEPSAGEPTAEPVEPVEPVPVAELAHSLQVMEAVPRSLDEATLTLEIDGVSRRMSLSQVEAVAVAGVQGPDGRSTLVVDLMLDAPWSDREKLRVIRLLSNRFDPRSLVPADDAMAAFKKLLESLIAISGAAPLPDPDSACGRPFRSFDSLAHYQRDVLGVAS
jgi:hypothetical protein